MPTLNELRNAAGLFVRCPKCQESFPIREAQLFDAMSRLPDYAQAQLDAKREEMDRVRQDLRTRRAELRRRSFTAATSSGIGQTLEQVAASLPGLPVEPRDCRTLLKPIDYLAFAGASQGSVEAIHFIEVKTGRSRLSRVQRAVKFAVESGAVSLRVADHRLRVR